MSSSQFTPDGNPPAGEDKALLAALRKGDAQAFDALFGKYWAKVFAVCMRHVRSADTAREMTQDVFKSLWERREGLSIEGPLEHYLHRAAKYQVFNFFREQAIRERHAESLAPGPMGEPPESAEDRLERRQLAEWAERLVEELPAPCRTAFRLQQDNQLSQEEIARTLNISVKTVEFHLGNARKRLRKALRP
jgi:RNA polymerase sigma-70 factor (ECF subfamily)